MVTTVGVPDVGATPGSMPILTWRIRLAPANADVVEPGLALINGLLGSGHPVNALLNDRAFSGRNPKRWATPLRTLGIDHIFDLFACDHGVTDHDGIRMIDGTPHCPGDPRSPGHDYPARKVGVGTLAARQRAIEGRP